MNQINNNQNNHAGFWRRTAAALIDTTLILLIAAPILTKMYGQEYWSSDKFIFGIGDVVINYILPAIAVMVFWFYKSATPGKMALGLSIVDADSSGKPTLVQFVKRYFGYYVSMLCLFIGIFWVMFDKRRQGWHDKIANTVVIRNNVPEKVETTGTPFWLKIINIFTVISTFGLGWIFFLAFTKAIPDTKVNQGKDLPTSAISNLIESGIVEQNDTIHYFYSEDSLSYTDAGNLFTDSHVISYETDEEGFNLYSAKYQEISDITFDESTSVFRDSRITIFVDGEEDFSLVVSPENEGDNLFYEKLIAHWKSKRSESSD